MEGEFNFDFKNMAAADAAELTEEGGQGSKDLFENH